MEGVGARFGRVSSRYGPPTVFTGRVRKWRKKWVRVAPRSSANNSNAVHNRAAANSEINEINGSRLSLLKWTPITPSQNNTNITGSGAADENGNSDSSVKHDPVDEEQPKRRFKYIPVALLEEQKNESIEIADDETNPIESETDAHKTTGADGLEENPDINDAPVEESQEDSEQKDLNESAFGLSLDLNAQDAEDDTDLKTNQTEGL
ncbi:unnamed protein product [Cuscuta epithymum]|uniref:Uncharacterized protein n=1 Tax=Cuscuta epithymum TaxID=186058 RepID=A0AAV0D5F8_9ASTE|nr:unnamed protein product [Cuscuta epithymum]CAH9141839.1 unnamed protein product [Cuscuta epithymum]